MKKLTNYYADASLIDGKYTNGVKGDISNDSFQFFLSLHPIHLQSRRWHHAPQRGHTPVDGPTQLISTLLPHPDGQRKPLS